ncbi:MAG: histone deacetylase [Solirubrobacterales bacterium]|nr:histone deacetylase [Solirubrobacterales bacterium]
MGAELRTRAADVSKLRDAAVLYFHHPSSLEHDPAAFAPEHPDAPARIEAIEAAMDAAGWLGCERLQAPAASVNELELVHTSSHIRMIRELCAAGGGQIDPDTYVGEPSYRAALHAAGGACAMARSLVSGEADTGFCAVRPSGHHAERDRAMGFCLFDNVAVAAELAIRELGVDRVLILDWDVHHGNGTAEIFRRRADVLVASIHQAGLFPGTGAVSDVGSSAGLGYTINAPVPAGSGEEVWLSVLEYVIVPAALEFAPQLVLISAGFDAHRDDPLGGCLLEATSFARMACHVRELAADLGAPCGAVLEGGYNPSALGECVVATLAALGGAGSAESFAPDPLVTSRLASHIGHFWGL